MTGKRHNNRKWLEKEPTMAARKHGTKWVAKA